MQSSIYVYQIMLSGGHVFQAVGRRKVKKGFLQIQLSLASHNTAASIYRSGQESVPSYGNLEDTGFLWVVQYAQVGIGILFLRKKERLDICM